MNDSTFLADLNTASDLRQPTHKHDQHIIELAANMARVEIGAWGGYGCCVQRTRAYKVDRGSSYENDVMKTDTN
jgi:hypothetical protein